MENNDDYTRLISRMTAVFDADRLSDILEEDARRFDRSFSEEREAGKV